MVKQALQEKEGIQVSTVVSTVEAALLRLETHSCSFYKPFVRSRVILGPNLLLLVVLACRIAPSGCPHLALPWLFCFLTCIYLRRLVC